MRPLSWRADSGARGCRDARSRGNGSRCREESSADGVEDARRWVDGPGSGRVVRLV